MSLVFGFTVYGRIALIFCILNCTPLSQFLYTGIRLCFLSICLYENLYFKDFIIGLAVINHIFFRITTKLAKRLCEEGMHLTIVIKGRKLIIFIKLNLVEIFLLIIFGMIKDIQKDIDSMFYKIVLWKEVCHRKQKNPSRY